MSTTTTETAIITATAPARVDEAGLTQLAESLRIARQSRTAIPPPIKTWPSLSIDDAWKVQLLTLDEARKAGDRLVGYKLGNIAKVMQTAFGLDQPDYGHLLGSTLVFEGTTLRRNRFIQPFVELEPAFVLKAPLKGPNVTVVDVMNATDYVIPSIEIIDSRVKNWEIGLADTLADNGSTGAVILGGTPRRLTDLTLRDMKGVMHFNGVEVMQGNTRNILGNPIAAIAWLCNRLAEYGVQFEAGHVILPGSCLEAVPMKEKGHWSGTFEGFGTVEFDFE